MDYKTYCANRFYLRGTSPLGIFNTVFAFLFNRVLILHVDKDTNKVVKRSIAKGTRFPPKK